MRSRRNHTPNIDSEQHHGPGMIFDFACQKIAPLHWEITAFSINFEAGLSSSHGHLNLDIQVPKPVVISTSFRQNPLAHSSFVLLLELFGPAIKLTYQLGYNVHLFLDLLQILLEQLELILKSFRLLSSNL